MNRNGEVVRFNSGAEQVSGYTARELQGRHVWDYLIPDEQVEQVKGVFANLMAGNFPNKYINHWKHRDGSSRLISWSNTALLDAQGDVDYVVATGIDITESERREREKVQLQRQLQQAQKMEALGQLTGGVAHDFNNILAAILGNAELATLRFSNEQNGKLSHYLNEISRSAERAKKLVHQMLAFSRGEQLPTAAVKLDNVIEQLLLMINSIMPSSIEIRTEMEPSLPTVLAEENQLDQVLLNLAINARDAIDGKGVLTISVSIAETVGLCRSCHEVVEGTFVRLSVIDSGGTLDPQLIDNIFDPFFTTKEVGKGSGMGLSMVHGIVHGWGGHVDVDVEPGVSTSFHLYLPLAGR
jgi:PAS domain S-box-containing protein